MFEVIYVVFGYDKLPLLLPIVFIEFDNLQAQQYYFARF